MRSQRRVRWSELTVGLLVVLACALAGAWFYLASLEREPALVLRADVARGEVLDSDDLRVVRADLDGAASVVAPERLGELVGKVALVDLPEGTLVAPALFGAGGSVAAGEGVVGLSLDPGEYPTAALAPGDTVRVVRTAADETGAPSAVVLAEAAVVVDTSVVGGSQDRLFVSLAMGTGQADQVAAAGAEGVVRLVQVETSQGGAGQ